MEGLHENTIEEPEGYEKLAERIESGVKGQNWWSKTRVLVATLTASVMISGCSESDDVSPPDDEIKVEHVDISTSVENVKTKELTPAEKIIKIIGTIDPETCYTYEDSPIKKTSDESEHIYCFTDNEKDRLHELREAAEKHELNYVTDNMSQKKIDDLYETTIHEIDDTQKRREHLSTLKFNPAGDWRLMPYAKVIKEMFEENSDEQSPLDCSVTIKSIGGDIEKASISGAETDTNTGEIRMSSKTIIDLLEVNNSVDHTDAVMTWLHELTHRYRRKVFKDKGGIDKVYSTAFSNGVKPEGYVKDNELPAGLTSILDSWLHGPLYKLDPEIWSPKRPDNGEFEAKMYPKVGGIEFQEREAMTASILGTKKIMEKGLHFSRPTLYTPVVEKSIVPKGKH